MVRQLSMLGPPEPRRRRGAVGALLLAGVALCALWGRSPPGASFARPLEGEAPKGIRHRLAATAEAHAALVASAVALLCVHVAKEGPVLRAPVTTPLDKRQDLQRLFFMAGLLSAVSGFVNVVAIQELGGTVAHQTGNTSHTGRLWGIDGVRFLVLLAAYFVGAAVAGLNKCDGDALFVGRYSPGLMSSAVAVAAGAVLHWSAGCAEVTLALWAFAQGLQNAITSRFGSMPIRTTHHTGSITDAGLGLGLWFRALAQGEPLPSLAKTALLGAVVVTYAMGGFLANVAWHSWGILAALPAALLMAAMAMGTPFGTAAVQKEP